MVARTADEVRFTAITALSHWKDFLEGVNKETEKELYNKTSEIIDAWQEVYDRPEKYALHPRFR